MPQEPIPYNSTRSRVSPRALTAFTLGMLAIPFVFIYFVGAGLGLFAILFGVNGLRDIRQDPYLKVKNLAHVGIILGSLSLLLAIWWCYALFIA